jgi:hypothetical protein
MKGLVNRRIGEISDSENMRGKNTTIYTRQGAALKMFREGGANAISSHTNFSLCVEYTCFKFSKTGGILAKRIKLCFD